MAEGSQTPTPDTRLFRDVFEASPIGIVVENLEGQPLFVNPAFCSMLGFREEELRYKHCVDFSPPEDAQKDWALFQQLKAGSIDHYQLEKRYFRKDGSLIWGRLSISLLKSYPSPLVLAMVEDITDKKNAEEARFRHAAVIESSDDAIASATLDGIIVSWNAGAQKIYGYSEAEAVGKSVNILVPPELPNEENKILETLRAGGRIEHFETIRVTKTGKRINVSLTVSPLKDSSGETVGISGIARDITERKRSEERLREYEEAVEGAEDMIGVIDREYRFLLANRQYLKMRNLTREQVVGHFVPEILGGKIFETVIKPKLDECFQGKVVKYEMKFSYPTVGERDLLLSYFPIEGINGIDRAACILRDITERKRAEQVLRETNRALETQTAVLRSQEELLKIFVKNVPVGVAMLDREMRYLQVSERWCSDFSLDSSEMLGRSHYEIFPDIPERWKQIHRRALAGETLRAEEDRWDREGGATWLRWEIRPWQNHDGVQGGILIFSEDITHRKHAEEALLGVSRKLIEAHEQERTRIGRDLHDDVVQRLALLAIELEGVQTDVPDSAGELSRRISDLRNQTTQITNDVQLFSHELHSSKLEYLGIVGAAKNFCKELGERQKLKIEFQSHDLPTALPKELSLSLFRVLQEALRNATKHSGVKHFDVRLWGSTGEIHLTVSDLGAGFDTETALKSTGLGLTSMQERLRLVGGELSITSQPKGGTTIHARVPLDSCSDSAWATG